MKLFILVMCAVLVSASCGLLNKTPKWDSILDDCSIDPIIQKFMKIQEQMDSAVKYEKYGNAMKAFSTWRQVKKELENLEYYYLPVSNAKIRISQARKRFFFGDKSGSETELTNTRLLILEVRSKMTGKNIQEIDQLLTDTETLEKEIKTIKNPHERFHALGSLVNDLISKKLE